MKKITSLYLKIILFAALLALTITGTCALSLRVPALSRALSGLLRSTEYADAETLAPLFEKVHTDEEKPILLAGDSIANQLLQGPGSRNPEVLVATSTAALMLPGQYLLIREYLEAHPEAEEVILMVHPMAMVRTWDIEWSYRYMIGTALETDTMQYLDEETIRQMESVFGRAAIRPLPYRVIKEFPPLRKLFYSYIYQHRTAYAQSSPFEISDLYLSKISDLCREKGVTFTLYASPSSTYFAEEIRALAPDYAQTQSFDRFPDYLSGIYLYPEEWSEDGSHLSGTYADPEHLAQVLREAFPGSRLLEILDLP